MFLIGSSRMGVILQGYLLGAIVIIYGAHGVPISSDFERMDLMPRAKSAADLQKPATSFPAVIFPPRNLTLLTSGIDPDGKAYLQISWLPPLPSIAQGQDADHGSVPVVDRYRITWRDHLNPKDEFRKTVNGDLTSYTIEHLIPGAQVYIEVQAFRWIDDKKIRSQKASIVLRAPSRKSAADIQSDMPRPAINPNSSEANITINNIFYQNGLLKANLSWNGNMKDSEMIYILRWYPKVCLGRDRRQLKEQTLIKPMVLATTFTNAVIHDLSFNCRYAIAIYERDPLGRSANSGELERLKAVRHFVTPLCQDVPVLGAISPNCPTLAPRPPSAPQNLSCFFLVQQGEISATCSWEPPQQTDQTITAYRALYARKLPMTVGDNILVLDRNNYVMRVLDEEELSFSIANLEENTEYLVHVQGISSAGFGAIAQLEFVTPKLGHSELHGEHIAGQNHQRSMHLVSSSLVPRCSYCILFFVVLVCLCGNLLVSEGVFRLL